LSAGGFSFGDIMTMVTEEVYLKTRAQQLPWTNSSLRRVLNFGEPLETDEDDDEAAIKGERRKLLLSIATTPPIQRDDVEALASEEAVPLDALYGMLNVLGVDTASGDGLEDQLRTGAARLKELLANKSGAVKADPELERLSKLAEAAEAEGAISLALKYRDEASGRADSLLQTKQAEAERLRQDVVDIAATYADNAATAILNFEHLRAAELFGKAYAAVKDWDGGRALIYRIGQADALTDHGYYGGDNQSLIAALKDYVDAQSLAPKESAELDWAKLEDRIGQTMQTLGERLADSSTLQESVTHYEAALSVRTEAAVPVDWAKSQNNLGNALYSLGARNSDVALLEKSLVAFDAALRVFTREAEPIRWATVVNNRAASQVQIADVTYFSTQDEEMAAMMAGEADPSNIPAVKAARQAANAAIDEAIELVRGALSQDLRAGNPLDWAMLQHTLATALVQRGEMNKSADDLKAAVAAYRQVLEVHSREQTPAQWLRSSNNLAIALKELSDITDDVETLKQAIGIYREVAAATSRTDMPLDWADRQESLGNALAMLGDYEESVEPLEEALKVYALAGEVTTLERGDILKWQQLQTSISTTMMMQGIKIFDKPTVERAKAIAEAARDTLVELGYPTDFYDAYLPQVDAVLGLFPQ
ncbi:MAG: tetratricopeptide repeat protein, partial [Devosia sp.]